MKSTESDLTQAGLDAHQLSMLRQQHAHLRSEGRSTDLSSLALRSRFINSDDLKDDDLESDQGIVGDHFTLQTILPLEYCRRFTCVPTEFSKGVLTLKCAQPLSTSQRKRIQDALRTSVQSLRVLPASRQEVFDVLMRIEQSGSVNGLISVLRSDGLEAGRLRGLVYAVLKEALSLKASDIHLSRKSDPDAWIAYRVDSVMRQTHLLPELLMQSLVARIKIEAGMDASNNRTAQDGRLTVEHEGRVVDFRISTQPLVDGESLVLRALDVSLLPSLTALFPGQPKMMGLIRGITQQSGKTGGLVFISGATGSGKSTTQYTVACGFRRDSMNIITVEDPVEYILPFAKQIQLQALVKQKAIDLERSILRQDPDILIFGEIRDADSARAALAFAESGHLVISTIHANSVIQVTERFLSMIDSSHRSDSEFLIAHFLRMIIHQRLMRRLCSCAKPMHNDEIENINPSISTLTGGLIEARPGLKKKTGCTRCLGTGYSGRVAAHETLHIPADQAMRAKFVRAFKNHELELPVDLREENGVEYTSRLQTLQTLMDQGLIDWPSVAQLFGVAE
ncbi:MAG: Flp pilus assembly complex ATPase component TadA [Burkholderiales bacterium]|jgi:type II secretory ATPase GspE/PulE/Tfp pilus assembly ATPase PilB-like protein|uniref:GspE/PulE family protein n=1 Tax=Limnobacter sp. TaxID=2003368 RepID=UPI0039BCAE63|nr:Flp pilus assembly complex ATPase component TadA [Burkholderiales bacterium]